MASCLCCLVEQKPLPQTITQTARPQESNLTPKGLVLDSGISFHASCHVIQSPFLKCAVCEVVVAAVKGERSPHHSLLYPWVSQQIRERTVQRLL